MKFRNLNFCPFCTSVEQPCSPGFIKQLVLLLLFFFLLNPPPTNSFLFNYKPINGVYFHFIKISQNYAFGKNIKRVYEKYLKGPAPFFLYLEFWNNSHEGIMFIREGRITTIVQTYIVKGPLRLLDKRRLFRSKQLYSLFLVLP